jgi:carboxymethylenebutenolidase
MCHDHDSRPPAPPRTGDVAERGTLTLTAADGTEFSAAYAAPAADPRVGVVLLPDIRGLHPYYVALAERFAEAGLPAVAIDYFGRTAGLAGGDSGTGVREADFDWQSHIPQTQPASIDADITAALAYLRERTVGDAADGARKPTLMVIAGADAVTPVEDQLALAERMRGGGADVETAVYDGAPHSFFDRAFGEWEDACADAWRRILALTDRVAG